MSVPSKASAAKATVSDNVGCGWTVRPTSAAVAPISSASATYYDVGLSYVGHAEKWDGIEVEGSIADRSCRLDYRRGDRSLAVVTMGRDRASLEAELTMEKALGDHGKKSSTSA